MLKDKKPVKTITDPFSVRVGKAPNKQLLISKASCESSIGKFVCSLEGLVMIDLTNN